MNHADLKNYALQARRDFIQAVTDRAAFYGVTASGIDPATVKGDVAIIAGRAFPASVVPKRRKLEDRIEQYGFNQTMEMLAYTWFNRFIAIRFMELHGYLEHGYRVLSHPDPAKTIPEILELAEHVDLPGLSKEKVIDLKLDGNKESELYRMLLLAQCHALHSDMPFLFEGIDDETELVLPENLLHSDSIIRKLVAASAPEDWQEVEVLGWLYQYYISERKDEVMARKSAVPTKDIPAVTQLFTPHWIVRYLVENSLGRLWLLNRPRSKLREHMPYYIDGGAETGFLKIDKPEDIRLLDPACGSGHMLTYAFDLLFLMYREEGYVPDEIPALILRHNLYGLEICPRAAQLANLALVFKAREKFRRFMQPGNLVQPHILALQDIHFDDGELRDYVTALDLGNLFNPPMVRLLHQFEEATTFGSLIQPCLDEAGIAYTRQAIEKKDIADQLFLSKTHVKVLCVLKQAEMLCQRYQVVVANPPYMGGRYMNKALKDWAGENYPDSKADAYALFIDRCRSLCMGDGLFALLTIQNWMFLGSFSELRQSLFTSCFLSQMLHLGPGAFPDLGAFNVLTTAFVFRNGKPQNCQQSRFIRANQSPVIAEKICAISDRRCFFDLAIEELSVIPGQPLVYWLSKNAIENFRTLPLLGSVCAPRQGLATGDNGRFVRLWHEVSASNLELHDGNAEEAKESGRKWFPYNKGGNYRKWYGNNECVVDWEDDGQRIHSFQPGSCVRNEDFYFREGIVYSLFGWENFGVRYKPQGFIFDVSGSSLFPDGNLKVVLAFLCSNVAFYYLKALAPTVNFQVGDLARVPLPKIREDAVKAQVELLARQA
jgi:hypothetical protein